MLRAALLALAVLALLPAPAAAQNGDDCFSEPPPATVGETPPPQELLDALGVLRRPWTLADTPLTAGLERSPFREISLPWSRQLPSPDVDEQFFLVGGVLPASGPFPPVRCFAGRKITARERRDYEREKRATGPLPERYGLCLRHVAGEFAVAGGTCISTPTELRQAGATGTESRDGDGGTSFGYGVAVAARTASERRRARDEARVRRAERQFERERRLVKSRLVYGVVPDGIERVELDLPRGAVVATTVTENFYTLRFRAREIDLGDELALTWRDASGAKVGPDPAPRERHGERAIIR